MHSTAHLFRSTPTRVGKTSDHTSCTCTFSVHPHACGENCPWDSGQIGYIGPPPRVWGKRKKNQGNGVYARSTPTRVGKTIERNWLSRYRAVHPHACGENTVPIVLTSFQFGPPPRVWGKPLVISSQNMRITVHPHACGENAAVKRSKLFVNGPPPRVWGKHLCLPSLPLLFRSTPTRVGKTS